MIYLLAPIIASDHPLTPCTGGKILPAGLPRNEEITQTILGSLPYTMGICVLISLISAFFFSRAITKPIKHIADTTVSMTFLKKGVKRRVKRMVEIWSWLVYYSVHFALFGVALFIFPIKEPNGMRFTISL